MTTTITTIPCKGCHVPTVTAQELKSDHAPSDAVLRKARGLCNTCYQREWMAKNRVDKKPPTRWCRECTKEMVRGKTKPLGEGQVHHQASGMCVSCYDALKKSSLPPGAGHTAPFTDDELAQLPEDVRAYHLWRRPFREALAKQNEKQRKEEEARLEKEREEIARREEFQRKLNRVEYDAKRREKKAKGNNRLKDLIHAISRPREKIRACKNCSAQTLGIYCNHCQGKRKAA